MSDYLVNEFEEIVPLEEAVAPINNSFSESSNSIVKFPQTDRTKKIYSQITCKVEKNPVKKMKTAFIDIIRVDDIRLVEITELSYYSIFYSLFGLIIGTGINRIFPSRGLEDKSIIVLIEAILQVMVLSIGVFYIKKIVSIIPSPFSLLKNYCPYVFTQTVSIVILGVVMMSTQSRLFNKFEILASRFGVDGNLPFIGKEVS